MPESQLLTRKEHRFALPITHVVVTMSCKQQMYARLAHLCLDVMQEPRVLVESQWTVEGGSPAGDHDQNVGVDFQFTAADDGDSSRCQKGNRHRPRRVPEDLGDRKLAGEREQV